MSNIDMTPVIWMSNKSYETYIIWRSNV